MIDIEGVTDIIATYKKHGWILRRVLLSARTKAKIGGSIDLHDVRVADYSEIDAAWFSRPPKPGGIAWEIRYLGDPPFALLETIDESDPALEDKLRDVEGRLRQSISAKISA